MVNALGQQFLIYDNQRQNLIILFSTPERLHFLANGDNWFMDGTFKSSPLQFTQWYTIHGLSAGRKVVGAYALLPDKRMMTYAEMLTQIQRLTNNVVTQSVMRDFELSMLEALTQIYPGGWRRGKVIVVTMRKRYYMVSFQCVRGHLVRK